MAKYRGIGVLYANQTMITKKIRNTINEHNLIEKNGHIVLGLSGGPDSVCLFHALNGLSKELNISIHVVHINHKFRPGAAEEDQAYVEQLCREYNTDCRVFTFDCPRIAAELGITGEEAGRKVRYEAFYKTALKLMKEQQLESVKIAVAHNMNDQAETLLIRLLRGTGTDGLAGMEYRRAVRYEELAPAIAAMKPGTIPECFCNADQLQKNAAAAGPEGNAATATGLEIIRPLLDVERGDIETYCNANKLYPRIDLTNLKSVYTRNKVRLELIPYISEKFGGDISERLNRLAKIAGEDREYLWLQARQAGEAARLTSTKPGCSGGKEENSEMYDCQALRNMHPAVRHRVILDAFSRIGLAQDISRAHLIAADGVLADGQTGKVAEFPQGFKITISYGTAVFSGNGYAQSKAFCDIDDKHSAPASNQVSNRTGLKASLLAPNQWREKKAQNPEMYNRHKLGNAFALLDYGRLCDEYNVSHELPDDWHSMTEFDRSVFLQRKLSILKRVRRKGDFLILTASGGTKKIQDYFVDVKVPRELRQTIQLVARGSEILWVIDDEHTKEHRWGRTSGKYKISDETESILLLEFAPIL